MHRRQQTAQFRLGKAKRTIVQIRQIVDEPRSYAIIKIFDIQIDIVDPRRQLRRKIKPQISRRQHFQVLRRQDKRTARFAHLLAVDRQKSMRMDLMRQRKPCHLEHRRPKQRVEVDDIFANKMPNLRVLIVPIRIERFAIRLTPRFRRRNVSNRRIHPYVKIFLRIPRYLKPKIRLIARYIPILKPLFNPRLDEVPHFVVERRRRGKRIEKFAQIAQRYEQMARFMDDGDRIVEHAMRIDQLNRIITAFANFAHVAILVFGSAFRAFSLHITIGQKPLQWLAIQLPHDALADQTRLLHRLEYLIS